MRRWAAGGALTGSAQAAGKFGTRYGAHGWDWLAGGRVGMARAGEAARQAGKRPGRGGGEAAAERTWVV